MDKCLFDRLKKIEDHIGVLKSIESRYLQLLAHEKVLFAKLFTSVGPGSIEDRKQAVYASQAWIDFADGLAECEASHLESKRLYELKLKAYDAEHLTFKVEAPAIKRQL
jgi:hypothetical protein